MAGLTYDSYVTSIANLLPVPVSDAGFQTMLPNMIDDAEKRLYRDLDLLNTTRTGTASLTAGTRFLTIPDPPGGNGPFLVFDQFNVITPAGTTNPESGTRNPLWPISKQSLNMLYPNVTGSAVPVYVAMEDQDSILVGPWPNAAYTIEFTGTIRPAALSSTNVTTLLSVYFPDLMVAGSMVFATGYQKNFGAMVDDPKAAMSWESHYKELLQGASVEEMRKRFTGPGWSSESPSPLATPART